MTITKAPRAATVGRESSPPLPEIAAVWIELPRAFIVRTGTDGRFTTATVERGSDEELADLARIVHELGEAAPVAVLGPSPLRLALEREDVAIARRPDRLVEVATSDEATTSELMARLHTLRGAAR